METKDLHQTLMNEAYDLWQKHKDWDKRKFITSLDYLPKLAVILGNLNYQVCNGGFSQWEFNGYKKVHSSFLLDLIDEIDKKKYPELAEGLKFTELAINYMDNAPEKEKGVWDEDEYKDLSDDELNKFDVEYYKLKSIEKEMNALLKEVKKSR